MPRPKKDKDKVLGGAVLVRLSAREVAGIDAVAALRNKTKSQVVRAAIDYLIYASNIKYESSNERKKHNGRGNKGGEG